MRRGPESWRSAALGLAAAAMVACGAGRTQAQGLAPRTDLPGLKRVDPTVGDFGPLSESQRLVPMDLRAPTGFDGVYQFERYGPFGQRQTMFARVDSGLAAVFPQSVYVPSQGGLVPAIPAGTVFVIGGLGAVAGGERRWRPSPSPTAVDMRAQSTAIEGKSSVEPTAVQTPAAGEAQTIWSSERLRRKRVDALMGNLSGAR